MPFVSEYTYKRIFKRKPGSILSNIVKPPQFISHRNEELEDAMKLLTAVRPTRKKLQLSPKLTFSGTWGIYLQSVCREVNEEIWDVLKNQLENLTKVEGEQEESSVERVEEPIVLSDAWEVGSRKEQLKNPRKKAGCYRKWLEKPELAVLVDFLVSKSKEFETVQNVNELIREFQSRHNPSIKAKCVEGRIARFRKLVHEIPTLDTETKVRLIFGLSAPVDLKFLEKLREEAEVTLDDSNRIIHYKKNGGGLELKGRHRSVCDVKSNAFLQFLAEKLQEHECSRIFTVTELCEEFKAKTGSPQNLTHLQLRFGKARDQIFCSELFNEKMKVRMMFATRTKIPELALEELRKNATVVVEDNVIYEYRSNDGSLKLDKYSSQMGGCCEKCESFSGRLPSEAHKDQNGSGPKKRKTEQAEGSKGKNFLPSQLFTTHNYSKLL